MVRLSCRLCLTLAILSARNVGLDSVVFNNSVEYCFQEKHKTTIHLVKDKIYNLQFHIHFHKEILTPFLSLDFTFRLSRCVCRTDMMFPIDSQTT